MELSNRVAIISEKNMNGFCQLYGNVTHDDLERIVNKHIAVAIDEIMEDYNCCQ
ncbi:MAG: hypothetical protein LBQ71_01420 [Hungatella sp.]|jgi:(2Fe-2S) ferredoxin|nr:hypothetical protein [Hungatella sp.]